MITYKLLSANLTNNTTNNTNNTTNNTNITNNKNLYYVFKSSNIIDDIPLYNNIDELKVTDYSYLPFCKLPDILPTKLIKLTVTNCNLSSLPERLPHTIEYINISKNYVNNIPWIPIYIKYFNASLNSIEYNGIFSDTKKLFVSIYNKYLDLVLYNSENGYDTHEFDAVNLDGNHITNFYLSTEEMLLDWLQNGLCCNKK
jgi:hypothetical protein